MPGLYKRNDSPYYWANYTTPDGKRHYESTHCQDKSAAKTWLKLAERRGVGGTGDEGTPCSLYEAISHFNQHGTQGKAKATLEIYRQKLNQIVRVLGDRDINQLSKAIVREYTERRRSEGVVDATIQKELSAFRQVLQLAQDDGMFMRDVSAVMPKFSVPYKPRKRWLSKVEFRFLRLYFDSPRALWLDLAVYTGGRYSEIEGLTWGDVDLTERKIHFRGTKTLGADRIIPIAEPLFAALQERRATFQTPPSGPVVLHWLNVNRDLKVACTAGSIPPVTPNDLRRTFASWLKQRGVDSFTVATLLGHTTSKMVELTYGRINAETLANAVRVLDE